jgi:hypothetical protein
VDFGQVELIVSEGGRDISLVSCLVPYLLRQPADCHKRGMYRLMHGCFHIGFHIRPDSPYLPDEGGQI